MMKNLSMLVATFALTIPAPLTLATPALAASNSSATQSCKSIVAGGNYPDLTVGECVSLFTTQSNSNGNGYAAQECSYAEQQVPDLFYSYYDSYSDCVHDGANTLLLGLEGGSGF
jgi:hypothetical protein